MKDWNHFIKDVVSGAWKDPNTGKPVPLPFKTIRIEEDLDGGAADMVAPLKIGKRVAVVSDTNTVEAAGRRVAKELRALGTIDEIVVADDRTCDEAHIEAMRELTRHADAIVAVGSGSLSDTVKFSAFKDRKPYVSFGTAASMNGYGAVTASVTQRDGYKSSITSKAPLGIFLDLKVSAAAPTWLSAAGLGDSLCRPVAQVEWWACHRLFDTFYSSTPFEVFKDDEPELIKRAADIRKHSVEANGYLHRVMVEASFGNNLVGSSHSGSMGEHQISHWIDMFTGDAHPGTTHGQQVGVASVTLAKLHEHLFARENAPRVKPTQISEQEFVMRYGRELGQRCFAEAKKKALDEVSVASVNKRLAEVWPALREECEAMMMSSEEIRSILSSAGGPATYEELGLPFSVWRDAVKHARDVRNRWSFLDLADDAGLLDEFLETVK
jgi:glycerol-1-phosphate dehydrogenase [NAD(P)+]